MFSCFSHTADKKGKIAFLKNIYTENMLSKVVELIERWVIEALKQEKNDKVFLCNDIDQIESEICGVLKSQYF